MRDFYFQNMLKGNSDEKKPSKKQQNDRFTQAIEKDIDSYLDTQSFHDSSLLSPELQRAKKKYEMMRAVEHSELNQQIEHAFSIIHNEGLKILGKETYESMTTNLDSAAAKLESLDLNKETNESFKTVLGINDQTIEACVSIAMIKVQSTQYSEALAIYLMLCTLEPNNPFFWYQAGIAAQFAHKYDFSIQAYEAALELDPTLHDAWLFAMQCYLSQGQFLEARNAFEHAKEAVKGHSLEESQKKLFLNIDEALKASAA